MNAFLRRRREQLDDAELYTLLPPPGDPDLSSDRHHLLKEHLMREIQQNDPATAPARPQRRRRLTLLAPVAAAVAAVVAVGIAVHGSGPTTGHPETGTHQQAAASPAAKLLGDISLAAEHEPVRQVRDDQFIYIDSKVFSTMQNGETGKATVGPLHRRQIWFSADGSRSDLLVENNERTPLEQTPGGKPNLNGPTYKYLLTLPTDPDVLLKKIYAETKGAGNSPDEEAFETIGDLIRESLLPPKLASALYRAAAKIPGVMVEKDAVDAVGRHGVAIAWPIEHGGKDEWIFDRHSLKYLGERDIAGSAARGVKPGTVVGASAILRRTVVDKAGQHPAS